MALSKGDRLKSLMKRGYFPAELPPPFNTDDIATYRKHVSDHWANTPTPKDLQSEIFSVPRIGQRRRAISVVNPVPQMKLSKIISDEWIAIRSHLKKSRYAIRPVEITKDQDRSIHLPDFNLVDLRKHDILSKYDDIVVSDTSRFYSTIYTHAIAWSLHTKRWCKDNLKRPHIQTYNRSLGAKLDNAVRHCQENQSIGIPIGPDTSRILAEIVAAAVDQKFEISTNLSAVQAFRNVDDWFIGHDRSDDGEDIIAKLAVSLSHFGLEIHPDKTRSEKSQNSPANLWPSELRRSAKYQIDTPNRDNLLHFIELAFDLSNKNPTENVLNFAVKVSSNFVVRANEWPIYEGFLLRAARLNATTLPIVTRILSHHRQAGTALSRGAISKLISDVIVRSSPFSFHFEVSWALFLAKTLGYQVSANAARLLGDLESSICALLALDCASNGLIPTGLNTTKWRQQLNADGLKSNLWLLAYEADLKGWLRPTSAGFVQADAFFSVLRQKNISFYDSNRSVGLVRTRRWPTIANGFNDFLEFLNQDGVQAGQLVVPAPRENFEGMVGYGDF